MKIKVDEDLSGDVAEEFRAAGHDALTVVEQGWSGRDDRSLWESVQQEQRLLVTADKGFADPRQLPPGTHCGIILLRSERESRASYVELARQVLRSAKLEDLHGVIAVVRHAGIRVHRAQDG